MSKKTKQLMPLLIIPAVIFLQSCLVSTPSTLITPEIRSLYGGEYKVGPYMKEHIPLSVAVLPFIDLSGSKEGATAMRLGFYNHFSSVPFKDMELYKVDDLLTKAGLTDPAVIHKTSPQKLGAILGVDAVILGEVSDFDKYFLVLYSQVAVGAEVKMYDTKTGTFLWSGKHKVRKHEGGISTNPVGLIATVIATALNVRDIQLLRANDDLFRDMVKTIPAPSLAQAKRPPTIALLTQDTKGQPKKAGDEIKVVIQGAPNMQASFDIGQYRKRIEMQEVEPGGYYGVYKVVPGDNIEKAIVTGYLTDDSGNTTQWVDAIGSVTLDTTAPEKPEHITCIGRNQIVGLRWDKSAAADLSGYIIYRSDSPLSGHIRIGKTEFNEFSDMDKNLVNAKMYYYRVTAVDFAGNESQMAQAQGMPVAPGPTPVSGVIETDTVWYSGASPYIIIADVVVKDKALLTIEPGTKIKSKNGGLIIEGRIAAQGDNDNIISFDALEDDKLWSGITFSGVKDRENKMMFVRVKGARTAINCQASSPLIENSEFAGNADVLKIAGAFSKPLIIKNAIYKNKGVAISVSDGASPRIVGNSIYDNSGAGLTAQSATPEIVQNTITRNRNNGIEVRGAQAIIRQNNLSDNSPYNMTSAMNGTSVKAQDNWWGSAKASDILAGISGRVDIRFVLDAPWPQGKPLAVPVLDKHLGGAIKTDSYLILSNSPYRITKDVVIDGGATLYIEAGVVLEFEQKSTFITQNGGIIARGTKERPITFTAASASPAPGFYASVVQFVAPTRVNSSFSYCIVKYAATAFDIYAGSPEISHSYIAHSSQSAIYCRKEATPVISFNTFATNAGEGAIVCFGRANPKIFQNNFIGNVWAIQSVSSIYIDARHNWWGASPPDPKVIWGENINIKPWLTKENPDAFKINH
ncbi:MAG: fibronectin type III [Syntrophaceae bacterium]|nr:MAG: fibronectin type III [Syntrophaceae bacterium]